MERNMTSIVVLLVLLQLAGLFLTVTGQQKKWKPPIFSQPSAQTLAYERVSTNHTIQCTATGIPDPKYKWFLDDKEVSMDQKQNTHYNPDTGLLTILYLSDSQEGNYVCHATNLFDGGMKAVAVSAKQSIAIGRVGSWNSDGPRSTSTNQGEYLAIPCDSNLPDFTGPTFFKWYVIDTLGKQNEVPPDDRFFVDSKGTFHIAYAKMEDANQVAAYSCALSNSVFNSIVLGSRVALTVKAGTLVDRPVVLQYPKPGQDTLTVERNANAQLECFFSGYSTLGDDKIPTVTWETDGGVPIYDGGRYTIEPRYRGRVLVIKGVNKADQKSYTCKGSTQTSNAEGTWRLIVTSPPMWTKSLSAQTVVQGDNAVFNCKALSYDDQPAAKLPVWFHNGQPLDVGNTNKYQLQEEDTQLTVLNTQKKSDIGCFQCSVSNNVGEVFGDACLNVLLPIIVVQRPPEEQIIEKGDLVNLTVTFTSDPLYAVMTSWVYRNVTYTGNKLPPGVTFDQITQKTFINTTGMSDTALRNVTGLYQRVMQHKFQTVVADILVKLKGDDVGAAQAGFQWWIILIVLLLLLIIVFIIICCCICCRRKSQEGEYPVDKKETASGLDPEKEVKEGGFPALSRAHDDYYPSSGKAPPPGDMDGRSIRDDESFGTEYGDDPSMMFNEDGSFIGEYKSKKANTAHNNPAFRPSESNV